MPTLEKKIKFYVVKHLREDRSLVFPHICLIHRDWDDWFRYETTYVMWYISDQFSQDYIGTVKIGEKGMAGAPRDFDGNLYGSRIPNIQEEFEELGEGFFSLGQDEEYYENVKKIEDENDVNILYPLKDLVENKKLLDDVMGENVFSFSLSREVSLMKINNQLRRIVRGGQRVERYEIEFYYNKNEIVNSGANSISMVVDPKSYLPSNMHVIIGRNGVGKTTFLKDLASSLMAPKYPELIKKRKGEARITDGDIEGVICVSFSPFDDIIDSVTEAVKLSQENKTDRYTFEYISNRLTLKNVIGNIRPERIYKNTDELFLDFLISYLKCYGDNSWELWSEVRDILSHDPIFRMIQLKHPEEPEIYDADNVGWDEVRKDLYKLGLQLENEIKVFDEQNVIGGDPGSLIGKLKGKYPFLFNVSPQVWEGENDFLSSLLSLFKKLSSGHTAVLIIVTRLIDILSERTIVLLDEPETHLHPPLISNLIKVISKILKKRNSLAIVSTHSPVILQEVPSSNVHIIERNEDIIYASKPSIETFGENVGRLTAEVFRLELLNSGYYATLKEIVIETFEDKNLYFSSQDQERLFEEVMNKVGGQVGFEGRMVISSLAKKAIEGELGNNDK